MQESAEHFSPTDRRTAVTPPTPLNRENIQNVNYPPSFSQHIMEILISWMRFNSRGFIQINTNIHRQNYYQTGIECHVNSHGGKHFISFYPLRFYFPQLKKMSLPCLMISFSSSCLPVIMACSFVSAIPVFTNQSTKAVPINALAYTCSFNW